MSEEMKDPDLLKALQHMDRETVKSGSGVDINTSNIGSDKGIVLYKILQGLDYTPMLGTVTFILTPHTPNPPP